MIAAAGQWLTGIVAVAILLYLIQCLAPAGVVRRTLDLTGGLILVAAILQPLAEISPQEISGDLNRLQREMELQQEKLVEQSQKELSQVIAERIAAYILAL